MNKYFSLFLHGLLDILTHEIFGSTTKMSLYVKCEVFYNSKHDFVAIWVAIMDLATDLIQRLLNPQNMRLDTMIMILF